MDNQLKFVTWKWSRPGYRSTFQGWHVNALYKQLQRCCTIPFEMVCITDDNFEIDPAIKVVKLWANPCPNYGNEDRPNCFYRLRMFAEEFKEVIGSNHWMSLDLDTVITGDITPLITKEEFKIWRPDNERMPCNGSMIYFHNNLSAKNIWEDFTPSLIDPTVGLRRTTPFVGSDQAWIAQYMTKETPVYEKKDGVYSFRCHLLPGGALPTDARIVFFHGRYDPWDPELWKKWPWIKNHYLALVDPQPIR